MKTIAENNSEFICDIQAPCFQALTAEETELVRESKTQVLFRKGDSLTKQGAFASYVLFTVDGVVKQYFEGKSQKSFIVKIILPGEFVGLSSVFSKQVFSYTSVALTDCRAFLVEKEAISKLVRQNGLFGFTIIKKYCEQNTELFDKLQGIVFKNMNGCVADTLLYLNSLKSKFPEIFQLLSRKDIADFSGITVESIVKLLKNLEKDNLIQLIDRDIIINDIDKMTTISRNG